MLARTALGDRIVFCFSDELGPSIQSSASAASCAHMGIRGERPPSSLPPLVPYEEHRCCCCRIWYTSSLYACMTWPATGPRTRSVSLLRFPLRERDSNMMESHVVCRSRQHVPKHHCLSLYYYTSARNPNIGLQSLRELYRPAFDYDVLHRTRPAAASLEFSRLRQ